MKIRKGDKVKIIAGKDKGAEGIISRVIKAKELVIIDGINMVTKHTKPKQGTPGGIGQVNKPIHVSNVMVMDPKEKKSSRIGFKIVDNKKYRVSKVSAELLEK